MGSERKREREGEEEKVCEREKAEGWHGVEGVDEQSDKTNRGREAPETDKRD